MLVNFCFAFIEYPELEGANKEHRVQLLTLHRTIPKSHHEFLLTCACGAPGDKATAAGRSRGCGISWGRQGKNSCWSWPWDVFQAAHVASLRLGWVRPDVEISAQAGMLAGEGECRISSPAPVLPSSPEPSCSWWTAWPSSGR